MGRRKYQRLNPGGKPLEQGEVWFRHIVRKGARPRMKLLGNRKTLEAAGEESPDLGRLKIPGEKDDGAFAKFGMRFPNHHRAADSWDFKERRFDRLRLDVFAAGDDQAVAAAMDDEIAFGSERPEITGGKPTLRIRHILPAAIRPEGAFGENISANLNFPILRNPNLAAGKGLTGVKGRGSFQQSIRRANLRGRLGHAIGEVERNTRTNGSFDKAGRNRPTPHKNGP